MASVPDFNNLPKAKPAEAGSPLEAFQRRLRRYQSGEVPRQVIFVGTDESYAIPPRKRVVKRSGLGGLVRNALYPISMASAVALGFMAHGVVQVARYHLQGMPDPQANPDIEMVAQVVMGFALAMVLGYFTGLRSRELTPLKSMGAALGVLLFHNLVHAFPHAFDLICSKMWVNYVVTHTKAHSLVWRGISFVW